MDEIMDKERRAEILAKTSEKCIFGLKIGILSAGGLAVVLFAVAVLLLLVWKSIVPAMILLVCASGLIALMLCALIAIFIVVKVNLKKLKALDIEVKSEDIKE